MTQTTYIFEKIYAAGNGDILYGYRERSDGTPHESPTLFLDAWRVRGVAFKEGDRFTVETNEKTYQKTRVWLNGKLVFELTPEIEQARENEQAEWLMARKRELKQAKQ